MSDNNKYDTMPFPFDSPSPLPIESDGLKIDLRDYFAGQALAGMQIWADYSKGHCNAALVERAYVIADAMLAERQKERK